MTSPWCKREDIALVKASERRERAEGKRSEGSRYVFGDEREGYFERRGQGCGTEVKVRIVDEMQRPNALT